MPNSRERLRTRLRRKAAFLVETGSASRRAMSAAETELFLWSIEKNDPNAFGLTKLSELRLNDPIDVTARGYSWNATTDTGIEGPMTLLTYAAWLGRAWIVRGLLRAGAVPEVGDARTRASGGTKTRPDGSVARAPPRNSRGASPRGSRDDGYDEYGVRRTGALVLLFERLRARYPEAATWLAIAAARARAAGGARLAENGGRAARRGGDASLSRCAFRACRAARPARPFAFATCRHVACEMCVWEAVASEHGGGFRCPACDDATRERRGGKETKPETETKTRAGDVARASRARWLALPSKAPDAPPRTADESSGVASEAMRDDDASACEPAGEVSPSPRGNLARRGKTKLADGVLGFFDAKGARKSFWPAPVATAARRRASNHTTREDRTRALLTAAASGDAPMVRAVVAAGVNVECADECGFTPLVLAAWRGRLGATRALLDAGADPTVVAAGGVTAARAARANGHARVLRALRDALGDKPSLEHRTARSVFSPCAAGARLGPPRVTLVPVPACAMEDVASGVGAVYGDGCFDDRGDRGDERTETHAWSFLDAVDDLADVVSGKFGPAGACSDAERMHFADAEGWVRAELARAIEAIVESLVATKGKLVELFGGSGRTLETDSRAERSELRDDDGDDDDDDDDEVGVGSPPRGTVRAVVLPKMRFLRYPDPGGRLNPHVDLRKVDEESSTGERSTHTFCLYLATCDAGGETVTLDKVREPKDPMSDRFAVGACKPKRGRLFLFPHGTPHAGRPVVDVPKVLLRGECYMVAND